MISSSTSQTDHYTLPLSYLDFLDRPDPPPIRKMTYISEIFQRERREMKQVGKLGINAKELIDTVEQLFVGIWISKMVSQTPGLSRHLPTSIDAITPYGSPYPTLSASHLPNSPPTVSPGSTR